MDFKESVSYVDSYLMFGSKPGLERIGRILFLLGNPQESLRFVHIAGTNGKGSIATYCESALRHAGLRTGLYISPYVLCINERMQCEGKMISDAEFASIITRVSVYCEQMKREGCAPTEFELITAAAMLWFCENKCDVVCLEVGLGGRFDATNIISAPLVSVIASISYDHTEYLGDTLEKIAFEKSGIIKNSCPSVLYPIQEDEVFETVRNRACECRSVLTIPDTEKIREITTSIFGNSFVYNGVKYETVLPGRHQIYNAVTAIEALHILRDTFDIPDSTVCDGLASVTFPARCEVISRAPLVILDGSHNPSGTQALSECLNKYSGRIVAVCAMLGDKDYEKSFSFVLPHCRRVWVTSSSNPRSAEPSVQAETAKKYCSEVTVQRNPIAAARTALRSLCDDEVLLCFGSLYLAAEIRNELFTLIKGA